MGNSCSHPVDQTQGSLRRIEQQLHADDDELRQLSFREQGPVVRSFSEKVAPVGGGTGTGRGSKRDEVATNAHGSDGQGNGQAECEGEGDIAEVSLPSRLHQEESTRYRVTFSARLAVPIHVTAPTMLSISSLLLLTLAATRTFTCTTAPGKHPGRSLWKSQRTEKGSR